jgi:hypothetical protein
MSVEERAIAEGTIVSVTPYSVSADAGQYASLDVDNDDRSHIAYYDAGRLTYAVYKGPGGNCGFLAGWQCDEIHTMGTDPHTRDVSLAVAKAGFPII